MSAESFAVFETPLGWAGIAWAERGVTGVQLPEPEMVAARAQLRKRFPRAVESSPPAHIEEAIEAITALLHGQPSDLSGVELDVERVSAFERRVYDITRTIPLGETMSYGQIARRLGDPGLARLVGQALARNPFPLVVPCHRVIAAGGRLGGFSARGGLRTKQRLLSIERANVSWQVPLGGAQF
jgi:methylated-DNA-[protein]-cysteine S-methyltransferase